MGFGRNNKYYIYGQNSNYQTGRDTLKFFEFDGYSVKEIHSVLFTSDSFITMKKIKNKIYFAKECNVCRYINGSFRVIKTIEGINRGGLIGGRNENDLFFFLPEGIAHYNGTDILNIHKKPGTSSFFDALIFENEIFFVTADIQKRSYIIKGTLKKTAV